jgi:hypothetical protein
LQKIEQLIESNDESIVKEIWNIAKSMLSGQSHAFIGYTARLLFEIQSKINDDDDDDDDKQSTVRA